MPLRWSSKKRSANAWLSASISMPLTSLSSCSLRIRIQAPRTTRTRSPNSRRCSATCSSGNRGRRIRIFLAGEQRAAGQGHHSRHGGHIQRQLAGATGSSKGCCLGSSGCHTTHILFPLSDGWIRGGIAIQFGVASATRQATGAPQRTGTRSILQWRERRPQALGASPPMASSLIWIS